MTKRIVTLWLLVSGCAGTYSTRCDIAQRPHVVEYRVGDFRLALPGTDGPPASKVAELVNPLPYPVGMTMQCYTGDVVDTWYEEVPACTVKRGTLQVMNWDIIADVCTGLTWKRLP